LLYPGRHAARRPNRPRRLIVSLVALALVVGVGSVALSAQGGPAGRRSPAAPTPVGSETSLTNVAPQNAPSPSSTPLPSDIAHLRPDQAAWVIQENRMPGTLAWQIPASAPYDIQGYADQVSATSGESLTLYVSTPAKRFRVEAYRLGYYQGLGARLVWRAGEVRSTQQPPATVEQITNMVEAPWRPSLRFTVDEQWAPGCYVLKLIGSDGGQSYVPLTIRDDQSRSALVVQNGVATWQAYNDWGGYSLYGGPQGYGSRSRVVSFDRPYAIGRGAGDLLDGNERTVISLVEKLGLDATYWTDLDLSAHPERLLLHRALITLGHDEYWSTSMLNGAELARSQGVNIAFLGANAVFRHIRLQSSPLGPDREEVDYKSAAEDPMNGVHPAQVTVDWREPPLGRPESELTGAMYECNPVSASMVLADAPAWLFHGSGLRAGSILPALVGSEYDRVEPADPTPASIEILAHSPVQCGALSSHADMTYYTTASGAGVFDSGTSLWTTDIGTACVLVGRCSPLQRAVTRVTVNLLRTFDLGPAGLSQPPQPNLRRFGLTLFRPLDP